MDNNAFEFWFANQLFISNKDKYILKHKFGSAFNIFMEKKDNIAKVLNEDKAAKFEIYKDKYSIEEIYKKYNDICKENIKFTTKFNRDYPNILNNISASPYALFYKGTLPNNDRPSVAIIGARNCSDYGIEVAKIISYKLAENGINIVSGMALGIDGIAQKEALKAKGYTLGVLGCSVDICYPASNKNLYDELILKGGIVSEYPISFPPRKNCFPARNRLISGFCDAIIVIEARKKSGTLITVDRALEQGKDVFVVPGRISDELSYGCNNLIMQGANIIYDYNEFINYVCDKYISKNCNDTEKYKKNTFQEKITKDNTFYDNLNKDEKIIYNLLFNRTLSLEEIISNTKFNINKIKDLLLELMIKDIIIEVGKGYYKLNL